MPYEKNRRVLGFNTQNKEYFLSGTGKDAGRVDGWKSHCSFFIRFSEHTKAITQEREKWFLIGGGISFDKSNEVIHIEQILGNYANSRHEKQPVESLQVKS